MTSPASARGRYGFCLVRNAGAPSPCRRTGRLTAVTRDRSGAEVVSNTPSTVDVGPIEGVELFAAMCRIWRPLPAIHERLLELFAQGVHIVRFRVGLLCRFGSLAEHVRASRCVGAAGRRWLVWH